MWNIAADGNGNPKLPGTDSCGNGCRPMVTVNSDGSYAFNQECTHSKSQARSLVFLWLNAVNLVYSMAQASKAIIPKDSGGPSGQRIDVTIGGSLSWAPPRVRLCTARISASDFLRYSIVVMNCTLSFQSGPKLIPFSLMSRFQGTTVHLLPGIAVRTDHHRV